MKDLAHLADRYRGALLGGAIGDALGAPFEGRDLLDADYLNGIFDPSRPLRSTGDTELTIALAQSLVERAGFDGAHLAQALVDACERESSRGPGPGVRRVLDAIKSGTAWDCAARVVADARDSLENGAAARVAPAALFGFPETDVTMLLARRTALVTNSHAVALDGAAVQACAIALLLGGPPLDRASFLRRLSQHAGTVELRTALDCVARVPASADPLEVVTRLGNGRDAHRSVPTALYCFLRNARSFSDTVAFALAVGFGGDTGTIASMTGALSGAFLGEKQIPRHWTERLEQTARLRWLADELLVVSATRTIMRADRGDTG